MKKITILIALLFSIGLFSQNIIKLEYFIDSDNGYDNNSYFNISSGDDITFDGTINIDGINEGLHTLYLRAKDDNNNWSTTNINHFICLHRDLTNISRIEYFIDNDPGMGMATKIDFLQEKKDFELTKTINLDNISDGLHTIYIRIKDVNNKWSSVLINNFICIDPSKWEIEDLEYFIDDDDPGYGLANKIEINRSSKMALNFKVDLNHYDSGMHSISIRAKRYLGTWSRDYLYNFEILNGLAITNFDNKNILPYPSPTTRQFTIKFENKLNNIEVVITDLSGKVVSDNKYHNTDKVVESIIGSKGIYIVYVFSNSKTERIFKIEKI